MEETASVLRDTSTGVDVVVFKWSRQGHTDPAHHRGQDLDSPIHLIKAKAPWQVSPLSSCVVSPKWDDDKEILRFLSLCIKSVSFRLSASGLHLFIGVEQRARWPTWRRIQSFLRLQGVFREVLIWETWPQGDYRIAHHPVKNHLLRCNKVVLVNISSVLVAQLYPIPCDPMDCIPPGSSVHGIRQAGILEWVAISFFMESSWPRDQTRVSCTAGRLLTIWATREALAHKLIA